jgi:micrococcal nuclease
VRDKFASLSSAKKVGIGLIVLIFLGVLSSSIEQSEEGTRNTTKTDTHTTTEVSDISEEVPADIEASQISPTLSEATEVKEESEEESYEVLRVVDGDTIDVLIHGVIERVRFIGIDTPESVDPRRPVECFGAEASKRTKELLLGTYVLLEDDPSQGNRDTHGRLLRYVFTESGENVGHKLIEEGYAHEYTYNLPYKYQRLFREAENDARLHERGLWGEICEYGEVKVEETLLPQQNEIFASDVQTLGSTCTIKGNVNSEGEKIYHTLGCNSYEKTLIDESKGEAWFCTEEEARSAGWRKARNCN